MHHMRAAESVLIVWQKSFTSCFFLILAPQLVYVILCCTYAIWSDIHSFLFPGSPVGFHFDSCRAEPWSNLRSKPDFRPESHCFYLSILLLCRLHALSSSSSSSLRQTLSALAMCCSCADRMTELGSSVVLFPIAARYLLVHPGPIAIGLFDRIMFEAWVTSIRSD